METPKEYYYTYYSYEEWGRGYFGSRGCKCLPEKDVRYFGSFKDKTFRPTQKIILKDDYVTREEAYTDEIILQDYYDVVNNPHFANQSKVTSTGFFVSKETSIEIGRRNGKMNKELGRGFFKRTPEQWSIDGKKASQKAKELGVGIFGFTKEQLSEFGKKVYELNIGIFALTPEQKIENCKKGGKLSGNQKWKCTETGYISNPPGLSHYQRKRGIDTSKRMRVE
jgi:hypothetical protein